MAVLYHPDTDPSRIYYGTDTRAQPLLIGAALAFVLHGRTLARIPKLAPRRRSASPASSASSPCSSSSTTPRAGCTTAASPSSPCITSLAHRRHDPARPHRRPARPRLPAAPPHRTHVLRPLPVALAHLRVPASADRTGLDGTTLLVVRLVVTGVVATLPTTSSRCRCARAPSAACRRGCRPGTPAGLALGATARSSC